MTSLLEFLGDVVLGPRCPSHHAHRMPCIACDLEAAQAERAARVALWPRPLFRGDEKGLR